MAIRRVAIAQKRLKMKRWGRLRGGGGAGGAGKVVNGADPFFSVDFPDFGRVTF